MQCRVLFWNQTSNTVYDKITSMKFNLYTSALLPRLGCSSETFFIMKKPTHRAGRHFRTKLMSRYIGSSTNGQFDVRIEELVFILTSHSRFDPYILAQKHPKMAIFEKADYWGLKDPLEVRV